MNPRRNKFEESLWDIFSRNTLFAYALEFNIAGFDNFDTFEPKLCAQYKKLDGKASIQVKNKEYNKVCKVCKIMLKVTYIGKKYEI